LKKKAQFYWIVALGIVALVGILFYSTIEQTSQRFQVCMGFKGATHCAVASGSTYEQAVRSAQEIDCELLANGRDENMVCLASQPASVTPQK
jgi:hypothetical protein